MPSTPVLGLAIASIFALTSVGVAIPLSMLSGVAVEYPKSGISPAGENQAPRGLAVDACAAQADAAGAALGPVSGATSGNVSIAALSRLLHGTWVRRLTIAGVPVQTNSYLYIDMADERGGRGRAMMIDRVNQGWDQSVPIPVAQAQPVGAATPADLQPATTGVLWSVALHAVAGGARLDLAGDYRGTGPDYPSGGFRFTESGIFTRVGNRYETVRGWSAPPQASDSAAASDTSYRVRIDAGTGASARPTITFINCREAVVDRYDKLSGGTPRVEGKSLTVAWSAALAAGVFRDGPVR